MNRENLRQAVVLIALAGALRLPVAGGPQQAPSEGPDSPAFREFGQRVQDYLKLRKSLPSERTTKHPEEITGRRKYLALAIREARSSAKQGDIFSPEISEAFLKVIRSTLQGTSVRRTIRQGEPQASRRLTVNGAYPEHLPTTTVPPTLLLRLPQLPEKISYRIVGRDFVLQDTEARLVIDFIPDALP